MFPRGAVRALIIYIDIITPRSSEVSRGDPDVIVTFYLVSSFGRSTLQKKDIFTTDTKSSQITYVIHVNHG